MNKNINRTPVEKPERSLMPAFLKEQRTRIIIGITLVLFSLYLLLSLVGFFFTGGIDQSLIDKKLGELVVNPDITAGNPAGKVGAWFSDLLINRWFGVSSFIFCYLLFISGIRIAGRKITGFKKKLFISMVLIIWGSLLLGFILSFIDTAYLFPGGAHGYFMTKWLSSLTGGIGTFLILVLLFVIIMFFGFERTFNKWVEATKAYYARKREEAKIKAEEKARAKAAAAARAAETRIVDDRITDNDTPVEDLTPAYNDIETGNNLPSDENPFEEMPENLDGNDLFATRNTDEYRGSDEGPAPENEIIGSAFANAPVSFNDFDFQTEIADIREEEKPGNEMIPEEEEENEITWEEQEIVPQAEEPVESDSDIQLTVNTENKEETFNKNLKPDEDYDPTLDLSNYQYPPLDLLEEHSSGNPKVTQEELEENKNKIVETLRNYKIEIIKIKATIGPTVTLYEIIPAPGVKISRIKNLEDDIALSLAALGIRIIAPIPGAGTIGIEVPNQNPEVVSMRGIIASKKFQESKYALPVALGRTISNETYTFDLTKMPHLLVAGATGQGKSVGLNAIITSLLYKKHPSQLKFVMVDPKKVELSIYSVIEKHFLAKLPEEEDAIITETGKVVATLNSLCIEMDNRYDLLKEAQVRNIKEYNEKFIKRHLNPNKGHKFLPYIVVIVDEFADLIMTAGKEVEQPIARIAQLARAIGIHMIIATQRPSTNIITGVIKANFPARIAFKVASMIDSRTILDSPGANQLIGRGDMLISVGSEMTRVQCAFVDTPEVDAVTAHIARQQSYPSVFALPEYTPETDGTSGISEADLGVKDPLFEEAARLVVNSQQGSTSSIQRRFSIGYNRAGRIIDQLEAAGVVGPFEGSKARQVLIPDEYSLEFLLKNLGDKI